MFKPMAVVPYPPCTITTPLRIHTDVIVLPVFELAHATMPISHVITAMYATGAGMALEMRLH